MITAGDYEGQAIRGKVQTGETPNGTLEIAIDMDLFPADGKESVGQMTTLLYFSEGAALYSYERLRLLGWKGTGADDIDKLDDIFDKRVPCRVTAPAQYKAADGTMKMGTSKLEIITGGGTVTLDRPLTPEAFKARLKAMGGSSGGGAPPPNAGGKAPPF